MNCKCGREKETIVTIMGEVLTICLYCTKTLAQARKESGIKVD